MSIKAKMLLPTIAAVLLVAAAILLSAIVLFSEEVEESTYARVEAASKVALHNINFLKAEASIASLIVAESPEVIAAVAGKNIGALRRHAKQLQDEAEAGYCTITDSAGMVILRTHSPETGDSIITQANVRAALAGKSIAVIEKGTVISLAVRSGAPIRDDHGTVIGAVSIGYRLDTDEFVDSIRAMLGCETGILLGDTRVSTTVRRPDGARAVGTRADPLVVKTIQSGKSYTGKADVVGRAAITQYTPLIGPDGRILGMVFVGRYVDGMTRTIGEFIESGLVITLGMLVVAIACILVIVNHIVTPIRAMTQAASALAVGDTDIDIQVKTNDEMRTLADAFNSMIENTRRQVRIVKNIAGGGLAIPLRARSEKDVMNRALENLNQTIQAQAAAIEEEHGRVRLMLDATPLAARLWNGFFKVVDCNEAAVRMFGLGSKQEYLERYFELSPEFQPDGQTTSGKIIEKIREAFEKGSCTYEWMYRLLDGTPVPSEVTMVRVPYKNDFVVASYSRDLREHKRMTAEIEQQDAQLRSMNKALEAALKEAERANVAKSDFLASMSHEMRTPLNVIIGFSELMLESGLPEETATRIDTVYNAGLGLLSIINNILDLAKIEAGKLELVPGEYDVPSMINDAIVQNALRIGSKPIRLVVAVSKKMPARLYGDELRIKSIINNLLSNAFKYTEKGRVRFSMWCARENENDVRVTMRVADTGCGIRREDVDRLFGEYMRFDQAANRKVDGTGLGLSITKRFVEMMGGSISVKTEYGKGSVFTVNFLQRCVNDAVVGAEVAGNLKHFQYSANKRRMRAQRRRVQLPSARVLVVDDNITNLDIAKAFLIQYGMHVDCVTSGQRAVDAVRGGTPRYNAVFMDHMMPEMDGVEATRRIRELGTEYAANIPVIALTANAIVGNEEMFLRHGFQAFISKPINVDVLDKVIRDFVRGEDAEPDPDSVPASPEAEEEPGIHSFGSIDGLDVSKGLQHYKTEKILKQVLRSYAVNTDALLASMQTVDGNTLKQYRIAVHGIKGSSRGVFAQSVGDQAEALEHAAQEGDLAFVSRNNPAFLDAAKTLVGNIAAALDAMEKADPKPQKAAPETDALLELRDACASHNLGRIDAAMEKIERHAYTADGGLAAWLRENIMKMRYAAVVEKLAAVIQDVSA